ISNFVTDTITLNNTCTATVKINSYNIMSAAADAFAIVGSPTNQIVAGGTATVIVSFHPDKAGNYSGVLTLSTDDAGSPIRTINLSGIGVKGNLWSLPSIDFGKVTVGENSTIRTSVKNTGGASLTINSLTMTGDGFSHGL